ncbi:MAG TPA: hypothetical protein VFN30_03910 [Chitinophagaceae bacterium]|nr:hypothetical protein [Chitinophagaceae bacterium]
MKREYLINVKNVDNRLVIYLNGETVWDSGIIHGDPDLDQFVDITESLMQHPEYASELIFEGFNDTYQSNGSTDELNPWHFQYRVFVRTLDDKGNVISETDMLAPYNEKHLSNPNIRAINNSYLIVKKNDEFKVVSNSLSQQFYK